MLFQLSKEAAEKQKQMKESSLAQPLTKSKVSPNLLCFLVFFQMGDPEFIGGYLTHFT